MFGKVKPTAKAPSHERPINTSTIPKKRAIHCETGGRGVAGFGSATVNEAGGINIAAAMDKIMLKPPRKTSATKTSLTRVGSMSRYSAMPPHTPAIILFVLDR